MGDKFSKLFSADEFRVSALVLCLLIIIASILVSLYLLGSIPQPLVGLAETLIYSIAGVNVASIFRANSNQMQYNTQTTSQYISQPAEIIGNFEGEGSQINTPINTPINTQTSGEPEHRI